MAGDFIKLEKATLDKPEILRIAVALNCSVAESFYLCVKFWCWCDTQSRNGHIFVTQELLDSLIGRAGFASALLSVHWLLVRSDSSLEVPNWDRHLSKSAKNRADSAKRKQKSRCHKSVTNLSQKSVTREEKRRDSNPSDYLPPNPLKGGPAAKRKPKFDPSTLPIPPPLDTPEFREAWAVWIDHRVQIKKPITQRSGEMSLAEMAEWGQARAIAAINHTVRMQWQGLREPDNGGANHGNRSNGGVSAPSVGPRVRDARLSQQLAGEIGGVGSGRAAMPAESSGHDQDCGEKQEVAGLPLGTDRRRQVESGGGGVPKVDVKHQGTAIPGLE